jgi:hypothetical protein
MLDVNPHTGTITLNFDDIEEMRETCTLDVADRVEASGEPLPLDVIAALIGRTGERARQHEARALSSLNEVL